MSDLTRRKKELLNSYNNLCSCYGDIISEQTKTINQLKELLKDLIDEADGALQAIQKDCESDDFSIFQYPEVQYFSDLLTKIDNAIGEKK